MQQRSRLQSTEQKQNMRTALMYVGLTLVAIVAIFFLGIPLMGRVATFFHDLRTSSTPVDANDTTPPAPPRFESLPEFTNKTVIDVTGRTEPGAMVKIKENGEEHEVLANSDGVFNFEWSLNDGDNRISAIARDGSGNESQESDVFEPTYDNEPPDLEIKSPSDGQNFAGSRNRQITIQGSTEGGISITINDRIVAVDSNGNYSLFTTLSEGSNSFTVKATDKAGNVTEKSFGVTFAP